ncbi:N-acetylneuraminate synthase family protein [Myxococcota bacterium]|nr:N-acetylneuraminate synthase family protein [Myxococcota bacterium]
MLIVLRPDATPEQQLEVEWYIGSLGLTAHPIPGTARTAIGITGNQGPLDPEAFRRMPGVAEAIAVSQPYRLVSREVRPDDTVVDVGGVAVGGVEVVVFAGSGTVEDRAQTLETARAVRDAGGAAYRSNAYVSPDRPYAGAGLGEAGLELLAEARAATGLPLVTEVSEAAALARIAEVADAIEIGARNMLNVHLLHAVAEVRKPVIIRRAVGVTLRELLLAAEHVVSRGNPHVLLCERGIRTFETVVDSFDINAIPTLKRLSHLPVLADPSRGIGVHHGVAALARAAVAAGADGLLVHVHPRPLHAHADAAPSLDPAQFAELMRGAGAVARAVGRELAGPA